MVYFLWRGQQVELFRRRQAILLKFQSLNLGLGRWRTSKLARMDLKGGSSGVYF